jgi:hypothetical protein
MEGPWADAAGADRIGLAPAGVGADPGQSWGRNDGASPAAGRFMSYTQRVSSTCLKPCALIWSIAETEVDDGHGVRR